MLSQISQVLGNQIRSAVKQVGRTSLELSSGKRINSAADDVAGSAIASRLTGTVQSIAMANRNISDALEAVSLSETGSEMIYEHLIAMRELAIKSANGTYTDEDRGLMQDVYQSHQESIQALSLGTIHQEHLAVLNAGWVQLAFGIDVSGSMGGEISNLQSAINGGTSTLASLLDNNDIYTQFSLTAVGGREDSSDSADTKAILGDPEFSEQLDLLGARGQLEDPYAAIMSMVGALGDDAVGFSNLADQRQIVYITDTGREFIADANANKAAAIAALKAANITFHAIRSGGGAGALDELVTETGGKLFNLAGDGSNIASALDDINDFILDNADDKRPTPMLVGANSSDILNAELPINLTLNALNIQFSQSDVETESAAVTAIGQVDSALEHLHSRRALLGATYAQLESALEENLNRNIQNKSQLSVLEDANLARTVATSVGMNIRARNSTEMLKKWFQIRATTLGALLEENKAF